MVNKSSFRPGAVAQACNPSTLGGWGTMLRDGDHPGQHGETPSLLKIQKISWAWWCVPVIPALQKAEAGELPEPRKWRLRWAKITPLYSSLSDRARLLLRKKNNHIKLPSGYVCKAHMKHKLISCLDLGRIPKIPHYIHANISKLEKMGNLKLFWSQVFWMRDTQSVFYIAQSVSWYCKSMFCFLVSCINAMFYLFCLLQLILWENEGKYKYNHEFTALHKRK